MVMGFSLSPTEIVERASSSEDDVEEHGEGGELRGSCFTSRNVISDDLWHFCELDFFILMLISRSSSNNRRKTLFRFYFGFKHFTWHWSVFPTVGRPWLRTQGCSVFNTRGDARIIYMKIRTQRRGSNYMQTRLGSKFCVLCTILRP